MRGMDIKDHVNHVNKILGMPKKQDRIDYLNTNVHPKFHQICWYFAKYIANLQQLKAAHEAHKNQKRKERTWTINRKKPLTNSQQREKVKELMDLI